MGISHHRKNQLLDYGSEARSLALAGCRWTLQSLRHWSSTVAGWFGVMQRSGPFRFIMEFATFVGVMFTVISFLNEGSDRTHNRAHQAWTLVAAHEQGNIGLQNALEFLHGTERYELSSLMLDKAQLHGVRLAGANLNHGEFTDAQLSKSNLAEVSLQFAKLSRAKLFGADLEDADLTGADLSQAKLAEANLSGATLKKAAFPGADLGRSVLANADLEDTILIGATLKDATASDHDEWPETVWLCRTTMPNGEVIDDDCASLVDKCGVGPPEERMISSCAWFESHHAEVMSAISQSEDILSSRLAP